MWFLYWIISSCRCWNTSKNANIRSAINIPVFKVNSPQRAKQHEPPIFELWDSINIHNKIPHEFG